MFLLQDPHLVPPFWTDDEDELEFGGIFKMDRILHHFQGIESFEIALARDYDSDTMEMDYDHEGSGFLQNLLRLEAKRRCPQSETNKERMEMLLLGEYKQCHEHFFQVCIVDNWKFCHECLYTIIDFLHVSFHFTN